MKRFIALALAGVLTIAPMTTPAEEADLQKQIDALTARVEALEAQIGIKSEDVSEQTEMDTVTGETEITKHGCTLKFKRYEVSQNYSGEDIVILYFDFFNDSGKTKSADHEFVVKVFQNGREQYETISFDNDAGHDRYTEIRSGTDAIEVAYASELQDMSDIIVNLSPFIGSSDEFVEFTLSLE